MTGGSLGVTGNTVVGSGAAATFTQDNSAADSYHSVGGSLILGAQAGGSGSYSLTDTGSGYAASLTVTGDTIVGDAGSGSFTQSGAASVHTTTNLILGNQSGGSGTYNLNGGSLSAKNLYVGDAGSGTFTVGGSGSNPALTMGSEGAPIDNTTNGVPASLVIGAQSGSQGTMSPI